MFFWGTASGALISYQWRSSTAKDHYPYLYHFPKTPQYPYGEVPSEAIHFVWVLVKKKGRFGFRLKCFLFCWKKYSKIPTIWTSIKKQILNARVPPPEANIQRSGKDKEFKRFEGGQPPLIMDPGPAVARIRIVDRPQRAGTKNKTKNTQNNRPNS